MNKTILSTIAALSIGLTGYLFAAQTDTQVSPSAINLAAAGVSYITIHTLVDFGDCKASVKFVDYDGNVFYFQDDDLTLFADNQSHLVLRIVAWDTFRYDPTIALGEATFTIAGVCGTNEFEDMSDNARIIREK